MNYARTKKIATIGMLSAMAYVVTLFIHFFGVPIVLFLKYDPKDVIITMGGFMYGPIAAAVISVVVSFVEMFTISSTGWWGLLMNIIQSCSFACTAALIYKKIRSIKGAIIGLLTAWIFTTGVMILWNYLITPIYMGYPREAVVKLLIPAFLPFNLIKGGLNAAITILLYKPLVTALRKARLVEMPKVTSEQNGGKFKLYIWVIVAAVLIIIACVLFILHLQKII